MTSKLRSTINRHGVAITTALLLLLTAWLLTGWVLLFLQPEEVVKPTAVNARIDINAVTGDIVAAHLFGIAGDRKTSETPQISALNLHLKGVFAFSKESPAFAIVNTAAKDEAFKVGQEIAPGIVLTNVQPTHILIKRAGSVEKVNLEAQGGNPGTVDSRMARMIAEPSRTPPPEYRDSPDVLPF